MADGGFIEIDIIEPMVIEIETPTIPVIPTIDTPPAEIPLPPPIKAKYECPLSTYCGTDTPCKWEVVLPQIPIPAIPSFSFPPQFNIPSFGFRFELPPPIFAKCPAFPEEEFSENRDRDGTKEEVPADVSVEASSSASAEIQPDDMTKLGN